MILHLSSSMLARAVSSRGDEHRRWCHGGKVPLAEARGESDAADVKLIVNSAGNVAEAS